MKLKMQHATADFAITADEPGEVVVELKLGSTRITFGIPASDARKLGRAFAAAGRSANNSKAARASSCVAARILERARK